MSNARPGSSAGRPPATASKRSGVIPQGTATRLTTAAAGRPGSRAGTTGGGIALNAQLQVADRPVTQQGLGGVKTAQSRGHNRQVQDKTYFLGLLRSKINETSTETGRLRTELEQATEDQASFLSYDKKAESLAHDLKGLQTQLNDYNLLVDKMNTDASISHIQIDTAEKKAQNDREAANLDSVFEKKQHHEAIVRQLEEELEQEHSVTETMIADMGDDMRKKYKELKNQNQFLLKQLEAGQQELDKLSLRMNDLDEELSLSPVKQEAARLYAQLRELEGRRDEMMLELQSTLSPQEERERLLKQVKDDNSEIASMERQTNEMKEKLSRLQEELQNIEDDMTGNQGGQSQQYRDFKKREEQMDEFLSKYEELKQQDTMRIKNLQASNVQLLEKISRDMGRSGQLPSRDDLKVMEEDLKVKKTEMQKSETTTSGLALENAKLREDLLKIEQLEVKVKQERQVLKEKIERMNDEIDIFKDVDGARTDADARKVELAKDKEILHRRRDQLKRLMQQMSVQYESVKKQLHDNETYVQLSNLEKKWQQQEQNNFATREFIASRMKDSDYQMTSKRVVKLLKNYNEQLVDISSGRVNHNNNRAT